MQEKYKRYCELKEKEKAIKKELEVLNEEIKSHFEANNLTEDMTDTNRIFTNKKISGWTYSDAIVKKQEMLDQEKIDEQEQEIAVPKYSVSLNIRDIA